MINNELIYVFLMIMERSVYVNNYWILMSCEYKCCEKTMSIKVIGKKTDG